MLAVRKRTYFTVLDNCYYCYHGAYCYQVDAQWNILQQCELAPNDLSHIPFDISSNPYAFQTFNRNGQCYGQVEAKLCRFSQRSVVEIARIPNFNPVKQNDWAFHISASGEHILAHNNVQMFVLDPVSLEFVVCGPAMNMWIFGSKQTVAYAQDGLRIVDSAGNLTKLYIKAQLSILLASQHVAYFTVCNANYVLYVDKLLIVRAGSAAADPLTGVQISEYGLCIQALHGATHTQIDVLWRDVRARCILGSPVIAKRYKPSTPHFEDANCRISFQQIERGSEVAVIHSAGLQLLTANRTTRLGRKPSESTKSRMCTFDCNGDPRGPGRPRITPERPYYQIVIGLQRRRIIVADSNAPFVLQGEKCKTLR